MGAIGSVGLCFFIIISALLFVGAKKYHVPLLVWGPNYELLKDDGFPALKRVSSEEFLNHFLKNVNKENTKKPPILLFVEETLSTEDFSTIVTKYENAFPALSEIAKSDKFEFLPSVEDPVTALTNPELKNYGYTWSDHTSDLDNVSINSGTIYIINLEDADSKEDRPDMLRRHDSKVASIYKNVMKSNNNVVAVLTGRLSSWIGPEEVRVRRQANETARNESAATKPVEAKSGVVLETKSVLIYTKKPPVLKIGEKEVTLQSSSGVSDDREKWQRAIFSFPTEVGSIKLRFRFENTSNYWNLSQIELEQSSGLVLLTTNRLISAPYDHSFYTGKPVNFVNGSSVSLSFSDIQVQPWKAAVEQVKKFGVADDHDTTFFTTPIWTGLIVTSIIGLILMWALSMIMDIRTMDQFDDPKGKTITVNVTD